MSSKMAKSLSLERDYSSGSESGSYSDSDSYDVGSFVKPGVKSEVKSLSADFQRQCSSQEICPNINMVGTSSYAGKKNKSLKRGRKCKEHVSAPVSEASESLGDNRSTSKRFCGENGNHGSPKPNPSKETNHAIVKASFKDDTIKIWFPTSSGLLELKNEVAKRLNLEGEFNLKYRDEENDLLLITCDDDLHKLPAFLASNTNTSVKLLVESLTMSESLTMLAVEQHVHNLLSQAAQSFGVSRSKLKHFCRDNGKHSSSKPNRSKKSNHANDPKRLQEVTVKATFKHDIIKFQFPTSSGLLELKNEVAKKLDLTGKLNIKYKDEDNDLILITCDADLHNLPGFLASNTNTSVKLHIMLVSE